MVIWDHKHQISEHMKNARGISYVSGFKYLRASAFLPLEKLRPKNAVDFRSHNECRKKSENVRNFIINLSWPFCCHLVSCTDKQLMTKYPLYTEILSKPPSYFERISGVISIWIYFISSIKHEHIGCFFYWSALKMTKCPITHFVEAQPQGTENGS